MSTNCSFAGAIRSAAVAAGRAPTSEQVADLNTILQSVATIAEDDTLTISLDGRNISFAEFVGRELPKMPRAAAPDAPSPAGNPGQRVSADGQYVFIQEGRSARWARHDNAMTVMAVGWQAQHQEALTREAARWPNPWRLGHENYTRHTIIKNIDPARAAILQAEAGVQ